ncbi:putative MFS myo-inositol transporter [Mytilinidion resinicola]|uniref:MFS myo-inositol transporter n=1 Tax=Mytilinidion resinicola TaxID=574789 RepID=A0A6A6Z087_9PEZI|nr:putative MFS myo-inositol transporter [Mytilinidion resinicola]KAF2814572.1 putative MFS myo-inositol transporter [Mytilinidion resinicola]
MNLEANEFIKLSGLTDYSSHIRRGCFLAQDRNAFPKEKPRHDGLTLTPDERARLDLEQSTRRVDKFKQPFRLWAVVLLCSLGAAVQGWDETAVNGAQIQYQYAFGIDGPSHNGYRGLTNSAPYLCCTLSCWLNYPLNRFLARRGVIALACFISVIACLGQAFPQTWQQLFVARLLLGLAIGPKSATIPIYAAECAPANIRGALVMMWQMWTAFGLMCGYAAGVAFQYVGDSNNDIFTTQSLSWRMMLSSPMILPLLVAQYIYTVPESPRWLIQKAHNGNTEKYEEAFLALCKLRHTKLQAARDLFAIHHLLLRQADITNKSRAGKRRSPFRELFTISRNRRALIASVITMFLQQQCGVNVMAYYSSSVLLSAGFSSQNALLASMGFGIINFIFAIPAVWTIDSFGRRSLLLATFPFMALFQVFIAVGFLFKKGTAQTVLTITGMYLFSVAYSPGEGPVPFVYSAESMPLYNRDFGMGIVTSVNWFFNFLLSITWPSFETAFHPSGAFAWYAAWCIMGWWMILFLVPETKSLTLEQLDDVFHISLANHAMHGLKELRWFFQRFILRRKRCRRPILIPRHQDDENEGKLQYQLRPIEDPDWDEEQVVESSTFGLRSLGGIMSRKYRKQCKNSGVNQFYQFE